MKRIVGAIMVFSLILFGVGLIVVNSLNAQSLNVLVYGIDGRGEVGEIERSDAIILINYNFETNKLVATSIPRDSYVKISCKNNKYDKINHAYAYGGEKCLNETVSKLFKINNVKNVMIDFEDVVDLIDYFGLIELVPNYTFCQFDESLEYKFCFEKDKEILIDGKQALAYMRNRKSLPKGDLHRIENQRQIFKILINRFLKLGLTDKIKFYNFAKKNIKTDIEIKDFNLKKIINMKQIELNEYTLKGEDYVDKYYYYKLDSSYLEKIKKYYI